MEEYYLNQKNCCAKIPSRSSDYLLLSNFLSEFSTKDDKLEARDNLGITELLGLLKSLIDNKIIEYGGVAWDLLPTEGHTDRVLSSDALYRVLANYTTEKAINARLTSLWSRLLNKLDDLENRVDSAVANGVSLSNKFGNREDIGISQKAITKAINDLYTRFGECTGCFRTGMTMTVNPDTFISSALVTVTVMANSGEFEDLHVYLTEEGQGEIEITDTFQILENGNWETIDPIAITSTTKVRAVGTILGMEYQEERLIMKQKAFYIGSSSDSYQDVIQDSTSLKRYDNSNIYSCTVGQDNEFIFVIIDNEEAARIKRLENIGPAILMNGMVIPMSEQYNDIMIGNDTLHIFKSINRYAAGTYPIELRYAN